MNSLKYEVYLDKLCEIYSWSEVSVFTMYWNYHRNIFSHLMNASLMYKSMVKSDLKTKSTVQLFLPNGLGRLQGKHFCALRIGCNSAGLNFVWDEKFVKKLYSQIFRVNLTFLLHFTKTIPQFYNWIAFLSRYLKIHPLSGKIFTSVQVAMHTWLRQHFPLHRTRGKSAN